MPDNKPQEKWYFRKFVIITAFLSIGPFALPLVWFNPRLSNKTKIIVTIIVVVLSYYLGNMLVNSIKTIFNYYQQMNPVNF